MQKLSVNTGSTCPNRDGTIGTGGCYYCNNLAFVPSYCSPADSVTEQLEKGKAFFGRKYPDMRYLAYFQAYTSTYSRHRERSTAYYREALQVDKIEGSVISTRPDCIDDRLLSELESLSERTGKRIMFEIGIETIHDETLKSINRGHTCRQAVEAIEKTASGKFDICVHLIMGLPGETESMMLETIDFVCGLPVTSLKLHQLQIIEGTRFARLWRENPGMFRLFSAGEYLDFCRKVIKRVPGHIAIERFTSSAPEKLLLAPRWGMKNHEFVDKLQAGISTDPPFCGQPEI